MGFKEKIFGLILILLGAWPFVLKIESVNNFFSSYKFLSLLTPGEILYQFIVIAVGVLLIWNIKPKVETRQ